MDDDGNVIHFLYQMLATRPRDTVNTTSVAHYICVVRRYLTTHKYVHAVTIAMM